MVIIIGYLMNSVFLDSLEYDVERLEWINDMFKVLLELVCKKMAILLNLIENLVIFFFQGLDCIVVKYLYVLLFSICVFLYGIGVICIFGLSIFSYFLFECVFCWELIVLGYYDGMVKVAELEKFICDDQMVCERLGVFDYL